MRLRMKIQISGTFHGREGVNPGDIIDVPDEVGARYCQLRYAEPVAVTDEERAVAPKGEDRAEPAHDTPRRRRTTAKHTAE